MFSLQDWHKTKWYNIQLYMYDELLTACLMNYPFAGTAPLFSSLASASVKLVEGCSGGGLVLVHALALCCCGCFLIRWHDEEPMS